MMNAFGKKTFLYLSIALIAAILVLPLGGKIVFSLPASNSNCPQRQIPREPIRLTTANDLIKKLHNPPCTNHLENGLFEIDGISFKYVQNRISIKSPPKILDAITDTTIEMIVKNNRSQPIRFNKRHFEPLFLKSDNTPLAIGLFKNRQIGREQDYPLLQPKESITLTWGISLQLKDDGVRFFFEDKSSAIWYKRNFQDDNLKVHFNYYFKEISESYFSKDRTVLPISNLGGIWTGSFCTTPVEIELID